MEKSEDLAKSPVIIRDGCGSNFEEIGNNNIHPEIWY